MPPNVFNLYASDTKKLADFYTMIARRQVDCPAEGVIVLDRCYVYEARFVMTADLAWLEASIADFAAAGQVAPVLRDRIAAGEYVNLPPSSCPTVLIAKAGSGNHGHVLADILPKLMNIGRLGCKHIRLLLPAGMAAYFTVIIDILGHLGIGADIETAEYGVLMQAAPLHYMTAVSQHDSRKSMALLELRLVLASLYHLDFRKERRLFVQRGDAEIRKLANAPEVEAAFIRHGYSVVYPRTLALQDQMALFASASHVAGSLGAGLANSAFAPEGCEIFMIDPGLGDFYFWDLACLMRQRFTWYFAGEFRHYSLALATADFAVDTEILQSCLTTLLK